MNLANVSVQPSSQFSDLAKNILERSYVSGSLSPFPQQIFKNNAPNRPSDFGSIDMRNQAIEPRNVRISPERSTTKLFNDKFFGRGGLHVPSSKLNDNDFASKCDFRSVAQSQDLIFDSSNLFTKGFEPKEQAFGGDSINQSFSWLRSPHNDPAWPNTLPKTSFVKAFDFNRQPMANSILDSQLSEQNGVQRRRKGSIGRPADRRSWFLKARSDLSQNEERNRDSARVMDLHLASLSKYEEIEKSHSNERRSNSNDSPRRTGIKEGQAKTRSLLQSGRVSRGRKRRGRGGNGGSFNPNSRGNRLFSRKGRGRAGMARIMNPQVTNQQMCNPFSDTEAVVRGPSGGIKPSFSKFNGLPLYSGLSNTPSQNDQFKLSRKVSTDSWLNISFAKVSQKDSTSRKAKEPRQQTKIRKTISKIRDKPKDFSQLLGNLNPSVFGQELLIADSQVKDSIMISESKPDEMQRPPSFGSPANFKSPEVTWRSEALANVLEKSPDHSFDQFLMIAQFCDALRTKMAEDNLDSIQTPELLAFLGEKFFESNQNVYNRENIIAQLSPIFTNLSFSDSNLGFMSSLFRLTSFMYKRGQNSENYYIDPKTSSIFAKIDNRPTALSTPNTTFADVSVNKLISFSDFQKQTKSQLIFSRHLSPKSFAEINSPVPQVNLPVESLKRAKRPKPKSNRRSKSKKKRQHGCKCSKSKCLRLHCVCFRNGGFCSPSCGCKNCYNSEQERKLVEQVRAATKDINPQAFESRFVEVDFGGVKRRFTKGCSCSKNNCLKNYCECRKNGMPCTPLCRCENCYNCKEALDPVLAASLHRKSSRKKKKIIFKRVNHNKLEMTEQVLMANYKKL